MSIPGEMPRLKGYRFPREIITHAVWAYHRFALGTAYVEDLLAERGVIVSRETVGKWVNRFGRHFARCIKPDRPAAADKWHLDEVVVPINGVKMWLWRAVDGNGDVPDIQAPPLSPLRQHIPPCQIRCFRSMAELRSRNDCMTEAKRHFRDQCKISWKSP